MYCRGERSTTDAPKGGQNSQLGAQMRQLWSGRRSCRLQPKRAGVFKCTSCLLTRGDIESSRPQNVAGKFATFHVTGFISSQAFRPRASQRPCCVSDANSPKKGADYVAGEAARRSANTTNRLGRSRKLDTGTGSGVPRRSLNVYPCIAQACNRTKQSLWPPPNARSDQAVAIGTVARLLGNRPLPGAVFK